ncbi:MAG: DUF6265 family protein [Bacteroidota bacterium]
MKKKLNIVCTIAAVMALSSWSGHSEKQIKKAAWLIGTWENKTKKGSNYETWTRISEDELHGKSYILKGKDTLVFESISLLQEKDKLFYIPTVKGQNNNLPVRFTLKTISSTELVFENPEHDFPQLITYRKINIDSLVAAISGKEKGQYRKETYPMTRIH